MSALPGRLVLGCLVLVLAAVAPGARAQGPSKATAPVLDRFGDPLPAGATARLGTVRFRAGELARGAALSPDGKVIALAVGKQTLLLDATTGAVVRSLNAAGGLAQTVAFSPDGKVLATRGPT